jgi:hypothetical protein
MTTMSGALRLPPEVTESPSAMDTEATVPEMVLTRLTPVTACSAESRLARAVSMDAWSTTSRCGEALLDEPEPEVGAEETVIEAAVDVDPEAAGDPEVVPDPDEPPDGEPGPPAVVEPPEPRAVLSALSAWTTFFRSAAAAAWAVEA